MPIRVPINAARDATYPHKFLEPGLKLSRVAFIASLHPAVKKSQWYNIIISMVRAMVNNQANCSRSMKV